MFWLWLACNGDESADVVEPEKTLLTASQEVIFASTEVLGPIVFAQCMNRQSFTEKIPVIRIARF